MRQNVIKTGVKMSENSLDVSLSKCLRISEFLNCKEPYQNQRDQAFQFRFRHFHTLLIHLLAFFLFVRKELSDIFTHFLNLEIIF